MDAMGHLLIEVGAESEQKMFLVYVLTLLHEISTDQTIQPEC